VPGGWYIFPPEAKAETEWLEAINLIGIFFLAKISQLFIFQP
jgi:hypothetical protein